METITAWLSGSSLHSRTGYIRHGVQYNNGRLIAPVNGSYLIHSYLELYENYRLRNKTGKLHGNSDTIKHATYKYNVVDGRETELVNITYSRGMSSNGRFNYISSYISTVVELRAGDEVCVKISNILLLTSPDENFFGINLV